MSGLGRSPDGAESTAIVFQSPKRKLLVDRQKSSLITDVDRGVTEAALSLSPAENLKLRIFLDASVIEIYANGGICLTDRIYPARSDSTGASLISNGGSARPVKLEAWRIRPVSKDRLTT